MFSSFKKVNKISIDSEDKTEKGPQKDDVIYFVIYK
jgi:hypothetical protein